MRIKEWESLPRETRPKVRYWLPAAAVDHKDLEQELKDLKERGFGGVEIVTLFDIPDEVALGEDGWGTKHWNETLRFIAETTRKLDLSMDIANGPGWPISMPGIKNADDPAALCELTYGVIAVEESGSYHGALPGRRTVHEEGTPHLVHLMAYLETDEKVLKRDSYTDLTGGVKKGPKGLELSCELGRAPAGSRWLIFAFYRQPAVHMTGKDQFYVVDHLSEAGAKACEEYWDSILGEREAFESVESIFCDSLEYRVMMEWTPLLPQEFEKRRGYSMLPYLPVMGWKVMFPACDIPGYVFEDRQLSEMINHDYLETLTECYCENHLAVLERMAEKYGKNIRYQVAYNKPFEGERCPLYVGIPENEALGRPAVDYQKTMASAAHLGRKKRYSFECAAEFGNAYGQTYEDLMWWVKRSQMAGMNAQVLHGASYSGSYHGKYAVEGQMEGVSWPGYEGFSKFCSNYWNRTLSPKDARGVLDTIARQNAVFQKKARVDCAILRQSYSNDGMGSEFCFYPDDGLLSNRGYSYETISPFLLELPVCQVKQGQLDREGVGYQCLIVPSQSFLSKKCAERLNELVEKGLPVIWIGAPARSAFFYSEWKEEDSRAEWEEAFDRLWKNEKLIHADSMEEVPDCLLRAGILPRVRLDGNKDLMTAARVDESEDRIYYALYAYNRISCTPEDPNPDEILCSAAYQKGTTKGSYERPGERSRQSVPVSLLGTGAVYRCDPWTGKFTPLAFKEKNGRMEGRVEIEEDEMLLLALNQKETQPEAVSEEKGRKLPVHFVSLELQEILPDTPGETSFLRSHFSDQVLRYELSGLCPWNELDDSLKDFAGRGTYRGVIHVDEKASDSRYILHLGRVQDTFRVQINGTSTEFPDQVLKKADITELLHEGENEILVEVVSNLYNRLVRGLSDKDQASMPFRVPVTEKKYGIWEDETEKCVVYEMKKVRN